MKAMLGDTILAEAPKDDVIKIEGNWYFPPASVNGDLLVKSDTAYRCPWRGETQYFSVRDGDVLLHDRAWSYPEPLPASYDRVGKDFRDYVAFWKEVEVTE